MPRKAGWRAEASKTKALVQDETPAPQPQAQEETSVPTPLSAADRNNPGKLSGESLRVHAHRCGLARSSLPEMSDEKIREQLRYIVQAGYEL